MSAETVTTQPDPLRGALDETSPDRALLAVPLEFLLVDHLRQRNLCTLLCQIADAPHVDPDVARRAADFVAGALSTHFIDDDEDLYPLMRRRARPEDRIEEVLGLLSGVHAEDDRIARGIAEDLRDAAASGVLNGALRVRLRLFAEQLRRHLTVENALVMPLAEARLSDQDRVGLARRMAARRGIALARRDRG